MRSKIIALCLFEGAKMISEADNTAMMQQPPQPVQPTATAAPQPSTIPQQETPQSDDTANAPMGVDGAPITIESIVDRLNVIRGGKSFSDPEVFGRLTTLFKGLDANTKINLDKVLTEIGKVVINSPDAATSTETPSGINPPQTSQNAQLPMNQQGSTQPAQQTMQPMGMGGQ